MQFLSKLGVHGWARTLLQYPMLHTSANWLQRTCKFLTGHMMNNSTFQANLCCAMSDARAASECIYRSGLSGCDTMLPCPAADAGQLERCWHRECLLQCWRVNTKGFACLLVWTLARSTANWQLLTHWLGIWQDLDKGCTASLAIWFPSPSICGRTLAWKCSNIATGGKQTPGAEQLVWQKPSAEGDC